MNIKEKMAIFSEETNKKNKYLRNAIIIAFLFFMTFIFMFKSPLNVISQNYNAVGHDSSVFRTIAFTADNGYIPYKDTFDHKGPLIYLINFIGMKISYFNGVWYIEFINLLISLGLIYKIARFKCSRVISLIISVVSLFVANLYFEGGNLTEEYALPYICGALYIFIDYLLNKKVTRLRLAVCGACLSAVLLLRPNMIALWIVFCLVIFIKCIREKAYKELIEFISFFMIGVILYMAPFIIWFAKNGALNDLWQSYIIFNSMYSKSSQGGGKILSYAKTFVYFICNPIFIFAAISCIIMCIKNYKNNGKIYIYSLLYTGLTLVLICLSGKKYAHYGITMIPCIALLLSLSIDFYKYIADNYFKSSKKYIVIFAFALLVGVYALQARNINDFDSNGENIKQICEIVTSRTNDDDKISVYGNFDIIYVNTKRIPVSKYSYQVPIKSVMPKISDEYFEALQKELPKIIVIEKDKYENSIEEFLAKNDYNLIWQSKSGENKSKTEMYLVYERVY